MSEQNESLLVQIVLGVVGLLILALSFVLSEREIERWVWFSLSILGTLLSTCTSAWFFGRAAEKKRFYSELDILRTQLASAAANLGRSVEAGLGEDEEPEIALLRIGENVYLLQMLVQHLNKITGSDLDLDRETITEVRETLSDLGSQIYTARNIKSEIHGGESPLEEIEKRLGDLASSLSRSERSKYVPPQVMWRINKSPLSHREMMSPRDRFLARIRRRNCQFLGRKDQLFVSEAIFRIVSEGGGVRYKRAEMYDNYLKLLRAGAEESNEITKTKFGGVLQIFIISGAIELFATDGDEGKPWVRFAEDDFALSDFLQYHDQLMDKFNIDGLLSAEELSEFHLG